MKIVFAGETHSGRARSDNEDAIGWSPERGLYLVADGMGGHASGEVASGIVRDTLLADSGSVDLETSVCNAHRAIVSAAGCDSALNGMGSTLVAVRITGAVARVVWVGDSRAYLWRKGSLRRVTRDHSFIELLRERDGITEAELRNHPNRNIVTQTLGLGDPKPSAVNVGLRRRDVLLLCSDGLNDELTDDEIAGVLREERSPETAASRLIACALDHGGRDNVSVVVISYDGEDSGTLQRIGQWLKGKRSG
ncbi:MAG: protein phosphatase 2C domain-containing protein [Pseudomonadales bacterium]